MKVYTILEIDSFDFDNANPKELNSIISNLKKLSPKHLKNVSNLIDDLIK